MGLLGASWSLLGAKEGGSLEFSVPRPPLGRLLGPSWGPLGRSRAPFGPSWGPLGPSWGPFGLYGAALAVLGLSWGLLGPSWGLLGLSWVLLGPSWASWWRLDVVLKPPQASDGEKLKKNDATLPTFFTFWEPSRAQVDPKLGQFEVKLGSRWHLKAFQGDLEASLGSSKRS